MCSKHGAGSKDRPGGRPPDPTRPGSRYAKTIPSTLREAYGRALADSTLLEQRHEIALVQARMEQQLEAIEKTPMSLDAINKALDVLLEALEQKDTAMVQVSIRDMRKAVGTAMAHRAMWSEVRGLVQERRVLVESERKRQVEDRQMVAVDSLMALMARIRDLIIQNVEDPAARSRVAVGVRELLGGYTPLVS